MSTGQGLNSHNVQEKASASVDACGASYKYSFEKPDPKPQCNQDENGKLQANVFTVGIYDKFCGSFEEGQQQAWVVDHNGEKLSNKRVPQRRKPPPNPRSYSNLRTTLKFDVTGSMSCSMKCADAYKSISQGPCGRIESQQNVMTKDASIDIGCGILSYETKDKNEPEYAKLELSKQECFPANK